MFEYRVFLIVLASSFYSVFAVVAQQTPNAAAPDPAEVMKNAKDLDQVAARRHLRIQEHNKAFLDAMKTLPRRVVDMKSEKVVWDALVKLVPELMKENSDLLALYPRYQADHKLLMSSLDEAIAGSFAAAQVCDKDAEKQKTDQGREDFLALAQLARKAADSRKKHKTLAMTQKAEIAKLMDQTAQDQAYFERLLQIVDLVRVPLEKQQEVDKFAQRLQRYIEQREQLRKALRDLTEKLEPSSPPPLPKLSGNKQLDQSQELVQEVSFKAGIDERKQDAAKIADSKRHFRTKDDDNSANLPKKLVAQVAPANKALIVVRLPADARLFLNDQPTVSKGAERMFITPELERAATFEYAVRIQLVDDNGTMVTRVRNISFRAGELAHVDFEDPLNDVLSMSD